MYYLLQPLRVIWKAYFFVLFALTLTVYYLPMRWALQKPSRFYKAFRFMRAWSWWLMTLTGLFVRRRGGNNLPDGPFIICPNHSSYLDIISMYRVFRRYLVFMGKTEINTWPLFHIFFSSGMNISVNRESLRGARNAFEHAKEELRKGHNVVIYPEGTIPKSAPKMIPFKNGAFKLSMEENIPIVPVTFTRNFMRLQAGPALKRLGGPGMVEAIIHDPVYPKDYADKGMTAMKKDIFATIEKPLKERYGNYG